MGLRVVRLGTPRVPHEGLRVGTVRRPPRGVRKEDHARLDYYDVWLPELSPSAELVASAQAEQLTAERWRRFEKSYRKEMKEPAAQRLLQLLALLSRRTDVSVGCYCEDESRCHRSILRELLREAGATVV
jgi:uncharacterized protein YeaO (DUF488 family)